MAPARRFLIGLVAVFALVLGAAACGSDDASPDGPGAEAPDTGGDSDGGDSGSGDGGEAAAGELPDPCTLVADDVVEEIFGEPVAEPESTSSDLGAPARACTWVTQASIDAPSIDDAGRILVLSALGSPSETMTVEELFDASAAAADEEADVCERSFWLAGVLHALEGGVYLTATAGLADDSDDAKAATTALMTAACESL